MSKPNEDELVKPFSIDYDEVNKMQKASMVPSTSSDSKKSVADELAVPDSKEAKMAKNNTKTEAKKYQSVNDGKSSPIKEGLQKMFEILPQGAKDPNRKLYLLLLVIISDSDNAEDEYTFKFIHGRQEVYDYIKDDLDAGVGIDCMKSLVLVDSPKITISKGVSIYSFMKDMRERGNIIDVSSFDIEDYYYKVDDSENGQE